MKKRQPFGQRKNQPHTIIIARGQDIKHFNIRPWVVGAFSAFFMAIAIGYLISTTYLILRDDLFNAAVARQAQLQHAYEDRIASPRGQVDRITSHRLLDQQFMENKIADLANRQNVLAQRSGMVGPLIERAKQMGIDVETDSKVPIPKARPETGNIRASLTGKTDRLITGSVAPQTSPLTDSFPAVTKLADVKTELYGIERAQIQHVASLTDAALERRNKLLSTARSAGLPVKAEEVTGTGGPFIPADADDLSQAFQSQLVAFDNAMGELEKAEKLVRAFPIVNPAPGKSVSSHFGYRKDPIIGRRAFHSGTDFRTPTGTPIRATADGKIVKAGRNGGYGKMVEIKHANGLSTRYAHLSKIHVKVGQNVSAGHKIGAAGSTGRSTGPHLHYEVRHNGKAVNPVDYLKAGTKLRSFL